MVWDIARAQPMEHTPWIFVGSRIHNGRFMADIDKSLVTTYHDPLSIIDNPLPAGGRHAGYRVNEMAVPARGTPVSVTIIRSRRAE
jgi:hypothetical protein